MNWLSIDEIHTRMREGNLTSRALVEYFLGRIEEVDRKTNSIIEVNPDALSIADEMDNMWQKGEIRGLLHGIPVVLKDNIDTGDKLQTTAGSLALEGHYAERDATVVKAIRDAGGIILAKANLSEWANFRGHRSSSGWSSRGGQTRNPYGLDRTPCGSSSGSAVAVAADLCTVAVGTETDGSVVCPSSINGVVGIKPSIGLVSRSGIIPIAHSQDTAGAMGRSVRDAALLLHSMIAHDSDDPQSEDVELDVLGRLGMESLEGIRLGVLRTYSGFSPKVLKIFDNSLDKLQSLGAELLDVELERPEGLSAAELNVLLYEYKHDLERYLASTNATSKVHSMEEVIEFNRKNADQVMPHFGQEHFENSVTKGGLDADEYTEALAFYDEFRENFDRLMVDNDLVALVAPSTGPAWKIDHINGDNFGGGSTSSIAAITGYSAITTPMGYISGLPVGISFIGGKFKDAEIIGIADTFERAMRVRQHPTFPEST